MINAPQDGITLQDIPRIFLRHKGKAVSVFLLILLLGTAAAIVWPRKYLSDAKLFVRVGRESITLDPTATTGQTIGMYESRELEINSILEVLKSRMILEKVVDEVGPAVILDKKKSAEKKPAGKITPHEKAVMALSDALEFELAQKSSVIAIRCKTYSPKVSQQIVASLLNIYQEEHVRINRTAGSYDFFVVQSELLKKNLAKASQELRDAKNEMELTTIKSKRDILQGKISTIDKEIVGTRSRLAASQAKVGSLQKTIDKMSKRLVTKEVSGFPNEAADGMRQQLYQLQIAKQDLLSKFTADHPLVIALNEQVKKVQTILEGQAKHRKQSTSTVNPERQALELKLLTEKAELASYIARAEALDNLHLLAIADVTSLNTEELKVNRLERRVQLAETNYRAYAVKLEQARIHHALEKDRISNVNVVQSASFIAKPVSPKLSLVLAFALFAATFGSLGTALYAEQINPTASSAIQASPHDDRPAAPNEAVTESNGVLVNS